MKNLLIAILIFALPMLCLAQSSNDNTDAMKKAEIRCTKHGSVIARVFGLYLSKTPPKEICDIIEKEYKFDIDDCKTAMGQVLDLLEYDAKMTAKQAGEVYFNACMKTEKERNEKNPKRDADIGRPAVQKDMPGAYYLVQTPEWIDKQRNIVPDPFVEKYQWFVFHEDGRFDYFSANKDISGIKNRKDVQELIDGLKKLPGSQPPTYYRFIQPPLMLLYKKENPDVGMVWGANLILNRYDTGKGIVWEPGDILLSLDQDGKPVYHKQLRRLKD